jgi:hypothetical protein
MAPRKTPVEKLETLEARYAKALETIEQLSMNQARLTAQLSAAAPRTFASGGQLMVGIRNVSNYTVGLLDRTSGQPVEYELLPEVPGSADPRTRAVVTYAFWQQLRLGNMVARGMIVRDDSMLGAADNSAPGDRPTDLHPDHVKNVVLNPREWILDKTEDDLRSAVMAMTSEPTLRRLLYAVDQEIISLGEDRYKGDPERARKAIRDLPAIFRVVEELAEERLDELNPVSKVRDQELMDARMARA